MFAPKCEVGISGVDRSGLLKTHLSSFLTLHVFMKCLGLHEVSSRVQLPQLRCSISLTPSSHQSSQLHWDSAPLQARSVLAPEMVHSSQPVLTLTSSSGLGNLPLNGSLILHIWFPILSPVAGFTSEVFDPRTNFGTNVVFAHQSSTHTPIQHSPLPELSTPSSFSSTVSLVSSNLFFLNHQLYSPAPLLPLYFPSYPLLYCRQLPLLNVFHASSGRLPPVFAGPGSTPVIYLRSRYLLAPDAFCPLPPAVSSINIGVQKPRSTHRYYGQYQDHAEQV